MSGLWLRVLVTGSQTWKWPATVWRVLDEILVQVDADATLIIVHGGCKRGADLHAHEWVVDRKARGLKVDEEVHPADWSGPCDPDPTICKPGHRRLKGGREWCPAAGIRRSKGMVDTRPDRWRAFCLDESPGTVKCIDFARAARINGIPIFVYS